MIRFRFPEEKDAILHYAKLLENNNIENIIQNGITSPEDAST